MTHRLDLVAMKRAAEHLRAVYDLTDTDHETINRFTELMDALYRVD